MSKNTLRLALSWKQSRGKRENQEDSAGILWDPDTESGREKGFAVVLADGMGGMARGEVYSDIAKRVMLGYFRDTAPTADPRRELMEAYALARKEALAARETPDVSDGGSTVVAALIRGNCLSFLSAGDSRICLLRGGGLIQLNREHTLGAVLDERAALGFIPWEMAELNTRRKSITNHLNAENPPRFDVSAHPIRLQAGDKVVLMSDGVFGTLDDDMIEDVLNQPRADYAEEVLRAVKEMDRPDQDNNTIVVISVMDDVPDTIPETYSNVRR